MIQNSLKKLFILKILMWNVVIGYQKFESVPFLNKIDQDFDDSFEERNAFVLRDPTYLIITPRVVRAGQMYRLVVNILPPSPPQVVRATLYKDNIQLDVVEKECDRSEPDLFQILVPGSSTSGHYRLKLEGNEVGWLTGSSFTNETNLVFSPRGATVLIQTDKKIYRQGTTVRIRIVALDSAVRMVEDTVDVFILSPRGVLVKRWLTRQCRERSIPLEFPLSELAVEGKWTIRVEATNSFSEAVFIVNSFEQKLFEDWDPEACRPKQYRDDEGFHYQGKFCSFNEYPPEIWAQYLQDGKVIYPYVRVDVPSFLSSSEKYLEGQVSANYSSGAPVAGNVSVRASLKPLKKGAMSHYKTESTLVRQKSEFNGNFKFRFRLTDMDKLLEWSDGLEVKITATVGDGLSDTSSSGHASVRIFGEKVILKFLGESPFILRASMPFQYYLTASLLDGSHVSEKRLLRHRLLITPEVRFQSNRLQRLPPRTVKMMHDQYGLWNDEIDLSSELGREDLESEIESLTLRAELKDSQGFRSYASLVAIPHHSTKGKHLQISTSTRNPKVGEYVILHVRSNFYLEKFRYIMLSKGVIVDSGQERMEASLRTFPLALTPEMAGTTTVLVYTLERGEDLVTDALTFPVEAIVAKDLKIYLEEQQAKGRVKLTVTGEPGTIVSLTGLHSEIDEIHLASYPTKKKITEQMIKESKPFYYMSSTSNYHECPLFQKWASYPGYHDNYIWLPKPSSGADANQTFMSVGLDILSDGGVPSRPPLCKSGRGLLPCLIGGCYASSSACDNKWDCTDRVDEKGCVKQLSSVTNDLPEYYIHRLSRLESHYLPPWLWTDVVIGRDGFTTLSVPTPEKSSSLTLAAFGLHPKSGISLLNDPVKIKTSPPFWLWVEAPPRVVLWEQIGIRVTVVNRLEEELPAIIVLANNPNYRFVSLEDFEMAQNFNLITNVLPTSGTVRRMLSGEHEHSVSIPAGETRTVYLPIVPVVTGDITITVQAALPGSKISRTIKMFVEPIGALQQHHTSLLLDLSNRAYLFTFLDIGLPEEGSYQSPSVKLSLFGDTVGGIQEDVVNTEQLLGLPESGCEPVVFSFLLTVMQFRHWSQLSQEPERSEKVVFRQLAILYQSLLSYQNTDGGFKYFETSSTSTVWVTSLVLRALHEASSHLLYVDPQVTDRAVRFLLKHQSSEGAFWEPDGGVGVRHMDPSSSFILSQMSTKGLNLSSSAFTIMQLVSIQELPEPLDEKVRVAIEKGRIWIEKSLSLVATASHPLEVALVAAVLHRLGSSKNEEAFSILARNARQEVKYVYWGEDIVPLPSYRVESQRPHLQPRQSHRHDAGNVAATACALRVYAARGELLTPAIVRWLEYQRSHDGGWMSTLDTFLAWEALHDYSVRQNQALQMHLTVTAESMNSVSKPKIMFVSPENVLSLQTYSMDNVNGSIRVQGKGNGSAVLQLTTTYYVTDPLIIKRSPEDAFSLKTRAVSSGRNSSTLNFSSCVRWKYATASQSSGITVLEIGVPTGYGLSKEKLRKYVSSRTIHSLRKAEYSPRKVSFFFDKIGVANTCVQFSVVRWFPVANLTKLLVVKVYEYYSPELFATELLDMSDITLDICQVCGSYQCPNCPVLSYYSSGCEGFYKNIAKSNSSVLLLFYIFSFVFIHYTFCGANLVTLYR